jgi:hypothetical protein
VLSAVRAVQLVTARPDGTELVGAVGCPGQPAPRHGGNSELKVTMVYAHGHLAEKAAALAQLGTGGVAVTGCPPADDHPDR